jgi:hypothetical protein
MMNRSAFGVVLAITVIAVAGTGCAGRDDNEVQSSVTADAGDAELVCSIVMDGKLAAFES